MPLLFWLMEGFLDSLLGLHHNLPFYLWLRVSSKNESTPEKLATVDEVGYYIVIFGFMFRSISSVLSVGEM
jgi:hypothetical protein